MAVGSAGIATSTDGGTWTKVRDRSSAPYNTVAYGNGRFVAAGPSIYVADVTEPTLGEVTLRSRTLGFSVSGEKGRVYRIQASGELDVSIWQEVGTVRNNTATVPFSFPVLPSNSRQFFRVVTEP